MLPTPKEPYRPSLKPLPGTNEASDIQVSAFFQSTFG